ncbi:MAG: response regulator [Bacteroidetes bacterium]|nr:response regulator [Bacteroidota bacterium]
MNPNGNFTFIIAEDEARIRKNLIKKIVSHEPKFVLTAEVFNGEKALQEIEKNQPDVLFTDIRMPVIDGIKLIEEVYYHYPDIIIVIISGYEDFSYAKKAIQFGVMDYLLKPVDDKELANTLWKITVRLEEQHQQLVLDTNTYSSNFAQENLAQSVVEYIREHYTEELSIQSLADRFHVNPTYMTRVIKKSIGKTPTKCIVDLRIQQAKYLIKSLPDMEIKEVAYKVGYIDQGYFSRIFKKITGQSPSEFKEHHSF